MVERKGSSGEESNGGHSSKSGKLQGIAGFVTPRV